MRFASLYSILFLFLIFACKKEEAKEGKVSIQIHSPYEGAVYQSIDTILVTATITSELPITQVQLALNNEKNIRQLPVITLHLNTTTYELHQQLVISDIHLSAGYYYVAVTITTTERATTQFRRVFIGERERKRTAVYVVGTNDATTTLYRMDNDTGLVQDFTLSGDFETMQVNSYDQQIGLVGNLSGDLNVYDMAAKTRVWSVENEGQSSSFFTAVHFADRLTFYADKTGALRGRNSSGNVIFSSGALNGRDVRGIFGSSEFVLTYEVTLQGTRHDLICRYTSSGVEKQRVVLDGPVEALAQLTTSKYIVAERYTPGISLRVYDLNSNTFDFRRRMLNGRVVTSVVVLDSESALLLTNSGLWRFDATSFEAQSILPAGITHFAFDETEQTIWTVQDRFIRVYSYPEGKMLSEIEHISSLKGIAIAYNR